MRTLGFIVLMLLDVLAASRCSGRAPTSQSITANINEQSRPSSRCRDWADRAAISWAENNRIAQLAMIIWVHSFLPFPIYSTINRHFLSHTPRDRPNLPWLRSLAEMLPLLMWLWLRNAGHETLFRSRSSVRQVRNAEDSPHSERPQGQAAALEAPWSMMP